MKKNINHEELLVSIAQDYYYSGLTISDLSRKYDSSRYHINNYLKDALKSGIVNIQIKTPIDRNFPLETQFKQIFDVQHIIILRGNDSSDVNAENIITYSADRLQSLINDSHVVGVTWGGTIHSIIDHFKSELNEDLIFTQFVGDNMKYNSRTGSTRMVEHAASKFESDFFTLPAPLYVTNKVIHDLLPEEPALKHCLKVASRMDLIFCGIGTLYSVDSIPTWHHNKDLIFPGVKPADIAGILFGRPYDIHGHFLVPECDTIVGVPLNKIMATPRRFGVIKSKFKAYAALGALRGNLLTDLVMDEGIAQRILTAQDEV